MNVASTSPSFAMSPSVSTPVASRTPEAQERDGRRVETEEPAAAQRPTMPTNVIATIHSSREQRAERGERLLAAAGASGVDVTSGDMIAAEQPRQQHHGGERRNR